jgi:hypothetical protein
MAWLPGHCAWFRVVFRRQLVLIIATRSNGRASKAAAALGRLWETSAD